MTQNLFRPDAHLSDEAIALYVDALILDQAHLLPNALLRHVEDCTRCKTEIVETCSLQQYPLQPGSERHPYFDRENGKKEKRISLVYRIAAVFLVSVSVGLLLYYVHSLTENRNALSSRLGTSEHSQYGKQLTDTKSDSANRGSDFLAANFAPSPNLESLVNGESRSTSIRVLSPSNGGVFHKQVIFRWKGAEGESLTLKILSNTEKTIYVFSVIGSEFLMDESVSAGLYYWKLENKDEVVYVGKFLVK